MSVPVAEVVEGITDPSARGIADHVADLIRSGRLRSGTRLPTVRSIAASIPVGPTTVATSWALLRHVGLIRSDGRNGTFVRDLSLRDVAEEEALIDLARFEHLPESAPDLTGHLARATSTLAGRTVRGPEVDEELQEVLHGSWPFSPGATAVARRYPDSLAHLASSTVRAGDRVLVEQACSPETAAVLAPLHAQLVHVPSDGAGMIPEHLDRALASRPSMVVVQPRYADPLAHQMTEARAGRLAGVLAGHDVLVVEEDTATDLAGTPAASVGRWLPDQTVLIRDLRRAYGPRIRVALVGGAVRDVERIRVRQELMGTFLAPMPQRAVAWLLTDRSARDVVAGARWRYARRWRVLAQVLRDHGLPVAGSGGLALWVRVPDADATVRRLLAAGIRVRHGAGLADPADADQHVWISASGAAPHHVRVASLLANDRAARRDDSRAVS